MRTLCAASLALALAVLVSSASCSGGDTDADASSLPDTCFCGALDGGQPGADAGAEDPDGGAAAADAAAPAPDAGTPGADATAATPDAAQAGLDAAEPGEDASSPPGPDAFVPLDYDAGPGSGTACVFNTDCPPNERCDEDAYFVCTTGPRGTGQTGVEVCTHSNQCEQAVCVEGWPTGTSYCSGPCGADAGTCGGQLTVCMYVSFLDVDMCVRNRDGGM